jgi:hypothetical protein
MKKFIFLFAVFLLLGGVVFYYGWIQYSLPANTYGIVFTKTRGWEPAPLVPGVFSWRWEKLIPGNFDLHIYPKIVETAEIVSQGTLPSASAYSVFLEGNTDFGYDLKIKVTYKVKPEYYPILASEQGVTPEGLNAWLAGRNTDVAREGVSRIIEKMNRSDSSETPAGNFHDISEDLKTSLSNKFSYFEIISVLPERINFPDMELYRKGRELYNLSLDAKKEAIIEESRRFAFDAMREEKRITSLQKYGELLTKYPLLIEYLLVEKMENPQPSDLEQLRNSSRKTN